MVGGLERKSLTHGLGVPQDHPLRANMLRNESRNCGSEGFGLVGANPNKEPRQIRVMNYRQ
jgi:hypothetical protein